MQQHIDLLGLKAKDRVTGFEGVVTSISFDLYGCAQAAVTPPADKEKGTVINGHWFDVPRLEIKSKKPVVPVPNFTKGYVAEGKKGAAEKPSP